MGWIACILVMVSLYLASKVLVLEGRVDELINETIRLELELERTK